MRPVPDIIALDGQIALQLPATTLPPATRAFSVGGWVSVMYRSDSQYEAFFFKGRRTLLVMHLML